MCAKIAQNHETKEQKAKNPSKVLLSRIFYVPLPRQRVIETGWWLSVRSSCVPLVASARGDDFDKQIIAE